MLQAGDRLGDWIIDHEIDEGGMGTVYRCHNALSGTLVAAVKVLKPHGLSAARERFLREVELLASVQHPAVVRVLGAGEDKQRGLLYFAMELLDGPTLDIALAHGPLPWERACEIFKELGAGLLAAHQKGVVHRDIKPQNIMLCADGAKLLDFGIAVQAGDPKLTRPGQVPGTVAYMAPEVFRGQRPDQRADIYSLGLLLWEAITGERAYPSDASTTEQENMVRIMGAKLHADPFDPGQDFSAGVRRLIGACTAPQPGARLAALDDFLEALDDEADERDPTADLFLDLDPAPTPTASPKATANNPVSGWLLFGVVIVVGVVGFSTIAVPIMAAFLGAGVAGGLMVSRPSPPPAIPATAPEPDIQQQAPGARYPAAPTPSWQMPKAEVPAGFPFKLPADANLYQGATTVTGTNTSSYVMFTTEEDPSALSLRYLEVFKSRGLNVNQTQINQAAGVTYSVSGWSTSETVAFSAMPAAQFQMQGTMVTLTYMPR